VGFELNEPPLTAKFAAMKLKIFLGIVALYALCAAGFAFLHRSYEAATTELRKQVRELGEKHAPLPTEDMKPLKEACEGKLTVGDAHSIAAYVAKLAPSKMPVLEKDYYAVDESVIGVESVWRFDVSDRHLHEIAEPSFPRFSDIVDPTIWKNHLRSAKAGSPELNELKYLIVARYDSLTPPVVSGSTYSGAEGTYGARVLAFPSGEVLCEGSSEMGMPSRVSAGGRGKTKELAEADAASRAVELVPFVFTKAVVISPLNELCKVGGNELCEKTSYWSSAR
jgi:hypothetical protein